MMFGLIVLLVATMFLASSVQITMTSYRQTYRDQLQAQVNLLADAACRRIQIKLVQQPDLSTDQWTIPADQLENGHTAKVTSVIEKSDSNPAQQLIRVTAEYPADQADTIRITREFVRSIKTVPQP